MTELNADIPFHVLESLFNTEDNAREVDTFILNLKNQYAYKKDIMEKKDERTKKLNDFWNSEVSSINEKIANYKGDDKHYDFKWSALVQQEIWMWGMGDSNAITDFSSLCSIRGFDADQISFLDRALRYAGFEIKG